MSFSSSGNTMDILPDDELISNDNNNRTVFYPHGKPDKYSAPSKQDKVVTEVFKGPLWIKNRIKKKWKEKYFVLYSNRLMAYWQNRRDYESQNEPISTINLALTENIERSINDGTKSKHKTDSDGKSLSKRGSMDFGAIFSNKTVRGTDKHGDLSLKTSPQSSGSGEQKEEEKEDRVHAQDDDDDKKQGDADKSGSNKHHKKKKRIQYIFKIVQNKRPTSLCVINNEEYYKTWLFKLESCVFGHVLVNGYLFHLSDRKNKGKFKENSKTQKWTKRWFVIYLRQEMSEMRYFEDETKKKPKGMVILSNLKCVTKSEDHKAKKKYGQLLYLMKLQFITQRVIILACLTEKERDLWFDKICGRNKELLHPLPAPMIQTESSSSTSPSKQTEATQPTLTNSKSAHNKKPRRKTAISSPSAPTTNNSTGLKRAKSSKSLSKISTGHSRKDKRRKDSGNKTTSSAVGLKTIQSKEALDPEAAETSGNNANDAEDDKNTKHTSGHTKSSSVGNTRPAHFPAPSFGHNPLLLRTNPSPSVSKIGRSRSAFNTATTPKSMKYEFSNSLRSPHAAPPRLTKFDSNGSAVSMPSAITSPTMSAVPTYYTSASDHGTEFGDNDSTKTGASGMTALLYTDHDRDLINDLRSEVCTLREEILSLKIKTAMKLNQPQQSYLDAEDLDENDVDDALLDSDQYLLLDKNWQNWSYLEIVEWVCSLEYGRFAKYKVLLFVNMRHRNVQGKYLSEIDKADLSNFFGIIDYGDICDLYKNIQILTANINAV